MKELKYWQAINEALAEELERDEGVCILGEDVGAPGGAFGATQGLFDRFGPERVRDTPISEAALMGIATGAAMCGIRPVLEIMFLDFILLTLDQLLNHAAKMRFMSGGVHKVPLTVITACGARRSTGPQHSQVLAPMLANVPGLRVVWPSTPADAKGLIKSAIRSDDPTLVIESLSLWRNKGEVPEGEYLVPLGRANIVRQGGDVTLIGVGSSMPTVVSAAEHLDVQGISCEVVDLRSLSPLDLDTVIESVARTGRLVVAQDGYPALGLGAGLVGHVVTSAFGALKAAPRVVEPPASPVPFNRTLEEMYYPDVTAVEEAVRSTLQ